MARPRKQPDDRRTERYNLRFTLAEMVHVQQQADAAGIDVAEYLRRRALGYHVPPAPARRGADAALIQELNAIGVNVNQMARAVHTGREFAEHWRRVGSALENVLEKVVRSHGP